MLPFFSHTLPVSVLKGEESVQEKRERLTIIISEELKRQSKAKAAMQRETLTEVIERLLRGYVGTAEKVAA